MQGGRFVIGAFPKIFAIGSKQTERLFLGEVEITEKIDGSQIGFGVINGDLVIRSKGSLLYVDNPEKMFSVGINVINNLFKEHKLQEGLFYYGEYLRAPRHSTLAYERVPTNHIALYAVYNLMTQTWGDHGLIQAEARILGLEAVPLIFVGQIETVEQLKTNLDRISALGKCKVEGFVVKNYNEQLLIGGQVIPILMGKYVSEDFKEVHQKEWKSENTSKGKFDIYKSQFCNTARWVKAVHYLRDNGTLQFSPRDIGGLIKRVQEDILEEEQENIKQWLFNEFGKEIYRESVKGLPQWYKEYLLEHSLVPDEGFHD